MRRVRYVVAMSLDGYIAGPKGEIDWITIDPDVDFGALFREFDTALIGRRTFEAMVRAGNSALPGMKMFVFSRTLQQSDHPKVTIVSHSPENTLASLRAEPRGQRCGGQAFSMPLPFQAAFGCYHRKPTVQLHHGRYSDVTPPLPVVSAYPLPLGKPPRTVSSSCTAHGKLRRK
jgi:hypothetical protein